ncbi:phage tail assembly chaperone [Paenibacillus sp. 1P03SA]|uniref:phage tail assembly chaperone n=1 Tax=Paenibacillus sp. 1P03SA TaxID=3132294 RepID=UPI0039A219F5
MKTQVTQDDVLAALLSVEDSPERDVYMQRFDVNFRVKAVSIKQINRLKMQATHTVGKTDVLDDEYFMALLIVEASVNMDWKNPQLLQKYDVLDAAEVVQKRLLSGEIAYLSGEIMSVSGFNQDERIRELKN